MVNSVLIVNKLTADSPSTAACPTQRCLTRPSGNVPVQGPPGQRENQGQERTPQGSKDERAGATSQCDLFLPTIKSSAVILMHF